MPIFSYVITDHTTRQVRVANNVQEVWRSLNQGNCTIVALPRIPEPKIEPPEVKVTLDFDK